MYMLRTSRLTVRTLVAGLVALGAFGASASAGVAGPLWSAADPGDAPIPTKTSELGYVLPSVPLAPAPHVRRLPRSSEKPPTSVPWGATGPIPVSEFLTLTHTRAFLVLHHGRIVSEWYDASTGPSTKLASWSVAKTMAGLLTEQAIREGRLTLDTRVVDVLPWLEVTGPLDGDPEFNDVTVRDLLDMTSGIDASESYENDPTQDPASLTTAATGTYLLIAHPSMRDYALTHRQMVFAPGTEGEYVSYNSQLLSMVLSEAFGRDYVSLFVERLWNPAGAGYAATWNVDQPGGIAKGFCCLNAGARDFARLGLLINSAGTDRSPVSRAWVNRILTPRRHLVSTWPYSSSVWHVPGDKRGVRSDDASAIGVFGQYIYFNRRTDTVIVKLSDHGIEQDEELTLRAMRFIATSWRR
jgi:hypothetical protein